MALKISKAHRTNIAQKSANIIRQNGVRTQPETKNKSEK